MGIGNSVRKNVKRFMGALHTTGKVETPPPAPALSEMVLELHRRAVKEGADYAESHMPEALHLDNPFHLREYGLSKITVAGLVLEFGVFEGTSVNHIADTLAAKNPDTLVYGFDSFEGLMEDWRGQSCRKGTFNLNGVLPQVRPNVRLVKGWFHETLPGFLRDHPQNAAFLHIDCDTYEATAKVLNVLKGRIVSGTVILFDEYFAFRGWKLGEYKAWQEFVAREGIRYEYLAFSSIAVAIRVL